MQWRMPVGAGPSSNTWPRCPPQRRHARCGSCRRKGRVGRRQRWAGPSRKRSRCRCRTGSELNRGRAHPAQANVPLRCSFSSGRTDARCRLRAGYDSAADPPAPICRASLHFERRLRLAAGQDGDAGKGGTFWKAHKGAAIALGQFHGARHIASQSECRLPKRHGGNASRLWAGACDWPGDGISRR